MGRLGRTATWAAAVAVCLLCAGCEPPEAAQLQNPVDVEWPWGVSQAASFGQMVQYIDANVTKNDILGASGLLTQSDWNKKSGTLLTHQRQAQNGPVLDAARLLGCTYHVGYLKGGAALGVARNAQTLTVFKDRAQAIDFIKRGIAFQETPVQVYLDWYYVQDTVAVQVPYWLGVPKEHQGRFVCVRGYDATTIRIAENGPTADLGGNAADIPIPIDTFYEAWLMAGSLGPRASRVGPCFGLWIQAGPHVAAQEWEMGWIGMDAAAGTADTRSAAAALRAGADPEAVLAQDDMFAMLRGLAADWITAVGLPGVAEKYDQSAALWAAIRDDADRSGAADRLDAIADAEDEALAMLAPYGEAGPDIVQLYPGHDTSFGNLTAMPLTWMPQPGVTKAVLEVSGTGDFSDRRSIVALKPKFDRTFVWVGKKEWYKIIAKDGGDRAVAWRVKGVAPDRAAVASPEYAFSWNEQVISLLSPADGYNVGFASLPVFQWSEPGVTARSRIVLSADGDFSNARTRVYVTAVRDADEEAYFGYVTTPMTEQMLAAITARDEGDKIIYWRVEDTGTKLSKIQPSAAWTMQLE